MNINPNNPIYPIAQYSADLEMQISNLVADKEKEIAETPRREKITKILAAAQLIVNMKIPYKFGGEWENDKSFDCSAYMQLVFKVVGITLPRTSKVQSTTGTEVLEADVQPGDLLFFDTNTDGVINHVGVAAGNNMMYHIAGNPEGPNLTDWVKRYKLVTARRVL